MSIGIQILRSLADVQVDFFTDNSRNTAVCKTFVPLAIRARLDVIKPRVRTRRGQRFVKNTIFSYYILSLLFRDWCYRTRYSVRFLYALWIGICRFRIRTFFFSPFFFPYIILSASFASPPPPTVTPLGRPKPVHNNYCYCLGGRLPRRRLGRD